MPANSVCMSSSVSIATPSVPTSPSEQRRVGVVAHQRGHVEGRAEARLAVLEQVVEALVGLLGGAEAGELAHRPQPPAVHRRVDAARERRLAREADPLGRRQVGVGVERAHRLPRQRRERCEPLRRALVFLAPALLVRGSLPGEHGHQIVERSHSAGKLSIHPRQMRGLPTVGLPRRASRAPDRVRCAASQHERSRPVSVSIQGVVGARSRSAG